MTEIEIGWGAAVMVMVVELDLLPSVIEEAVRVTVDGLGTLAGAV